MRLIIKLFIVLDLIVACSGNSQRALVTGIFAQRKNFDPSKNTALIFLSKDKCISCYSHIREMIDRGIEANNVPMTNVLIVVPNIRSVEKPSFLTDFLVFKHKIDTSQIINKDNAGVMSFIKDLKIDIKSVTMAVYEARTDSIKIQVIKE